jgi:hypothetical protein
MDGRKILTPQGDIRQLGLGTQGTTPTFCSREGEDHGLEHPNHRRDLHWT